MNDISPHFKFVSLALSLLYIRVPGWMIQVILVLVINLDSDGSRHNSHRTVLLYDIP